MKKKKLRTGKKMGKKCVNQGTKAEVTWGRGSGMKITMSPVSRKAQHH